LKKEQPIEEDNLTEEEDKVPDNIASLEENNKESAEE